MRNELVIELGHYKLRDGEIVEITHQTPKGNWMGLDSNNLRKFWSREGKHTVFYSMDIVEKVCQK